MGDSESDSDHTSNNNPVRDWQHGSKQRKRPRANDPSDTSSDSENEVRPKSGKQKKRGRRENIEDLVNKRVSEILSRQNVIQGFQNMSSNANNPAKNDIVPTFDPEKSDLTSVNWIHKIEQLAIIHGWNDVTKSYYMQSKLSGIAKVWYNALQNYDKTWSEWKTAVVEAFPSHEHFIDNLKRMIDRKKGSNETMMHYYYSKCILIRKCDISDSNAVSCVIDGLPLSTQGAAKSGSYKSPEELFQGFLSKLESDSSIKEKHVPKLSETCHICKKSGHIARRCWFRFNNDELPSTSQRPSTSYRRHSPTRQHLPKKCSNCGKNGHLRDDCWFLKSATVKTLKRQVQNDVYTILIKINNFACKGYLDTGSQINVAQANLIDKLGIKLMRTTMYITGFGNKIIYPIGRALVNMCFDNFAIDTIVHFVDVDMGLIDIIIGQPVINSNEVEMKIVGNKVALKKIENKSEVTNFNFDENREKFEVRAVENIKIPPNNTLSVKVNSSCRNNLIIPAKICYNYAISTVWAAESTFTIDVTNVGSDTLVVDSGKILTRGYNFQPPNQDYVVREIRSIEMSKIKVGNISKKHLVLLFELLKNFQFCFATTTSELGMTDFVEFEINLSSKEPIFYKPYRVSEKEKAIIREKINDLLTNNIIRESKSCYASPAILVKKKNGDYRVAIDYRKLNKITVKDRYPLPNIEDHIARLKGFKYFCVLDMTQGYYQIPVSENSIEKTAFVTTDGQYEFLRMPFGVCNAPATFQRLLNRVLGNLRHDKVVNYLDDILILCNSVEEGLELLKTVLELFQKANLKLNLKKCQFFESSIEYLGYEINEFGIKPGERKIHAVSHFPTPKNIHEVRQFLGLCSYFRKFIKNHALIVLPISQLLKKGVPWTWGENQQDAFQKIKQLLTSRPILSIFDVNRETELHTDASSKGLAGILMQKHANGLKPVMYYSRATTREESVYHSYDLETLAIIESIKRFRVYLSGIHFKIITDCSAVRLTFSKRDLVPRVARWWLAIQDFDFEIEHRPGSRMAHVDALSRNIGESNILKINIDDWICIVQSQDDELLSIKRRLNQENPDKELNNIYFEKNDRLFRKTADGKYKLVIPKYARFNLMRKFHDDIGHVGLNKCEKLIKDKFWFKGMTRFIKKYVNSCLDCAFKKGQYGRKEGYLFPMKKPTQPLHTWHIDHLGPFCKSSGFSYIFVIVDSFTKYLFARPTKSTKSKEVIYHLKDLFSMFGVPKRIISDQGRAFKSKNFKSFCSDFKIKHVLNTVASPRSNGQVERYNRTLLDAINTSIDDECDWHGKLPQVVLGVNNTTNSSTGLSPHRLMFGFDKNIIGDLGEATVEDINREADKNTATTFMDKQSRRMKKHFDSKRKGSKKYNVNDLVLWSGAGVEKKETNRKTGIRFGGPYKIKKVLGNDRYKIASLKGLKGYKKYTATVSVEQLRPFVGGITDSDNSDSDVNSTDELIDLLEG